MRTSSPAVQLGSTRRESPPLPPGAPFYKHLWRAWQRVARAIGTLLSRVVVTLVYFVAVTPFALGSRLFSDPLGLRRRPVRWVPLSPPADIEEARRGF